MAPYRTQMKIIADVLSAAKEGDFEGVGISHLLHKGNISYSRLIVLLEELVKSGLLEVVNQERGNHYRLNDKGHRFLQAYYHFEEFAKSFGLRL